MPKIVDHQARRSIVAETAAKLIAQSGLDGLTVREVARLSGCSTSIVSHYFSSKQDLLLSAYRMRMERTNRAIVESRMAGESLFESFTVLLPIDEERRESWRIWLAFWGLATADNNFLLEQRQRSREAVDMVRDAISAAGTPLTGEALEIASQALLSSISGIATQASYDAERWPPERQTAILRLLLERFGIPNPDLPWIE